MKNLTMRLTIAAVTLAAAAVAASAETYRADIPMAFSVGNKLMPAGSYDFAVTTNVSGHRTVVVRNRHAVKESAMLSTVPGSDAPKAWRAEGAPKIGFDCLGQSCSLSKLYNGHDVSAYQVPTRKAAPAEKERVASITLPLVRTE